MPEEVEVERELRVGTEEVEELEVEATAKTLEGGRLSLARISITLDKEVRTDGDRAELKEIEVSCAEGRRGGREPTVSRTRRADESKGERISPSLSI